MSLYFHDVPTRVTGSALLCGLLNDTCHVHLFLSLVHNMTLDDARPCVKIDLLHRQERTWLLK